MYEDIFSSAVTLRALEFYLKVFSALFFQWESSRLGLFQSKYENVCIITPYFLFNPHFILLRENVMKFYLNSSSLNLTYDISYISCWAINSCSSRHQSTPMKTAYVTIQCLYIVFHLLHKLSYLDSSITEWAPKGQFPMSYMYL